MVTYFDFTGCSPFKAYFGRESNRGKYLVMADDFSVEEDTCAICLSDREQVSFKLQKNYIVAGFCSLIHKLININLLH